MYQRTSERLRHKKRAITSWDYERLILDKFPEVFRIKCLNHYRYDKITTSKLSAGYVTLIPIAKLNTQERISWKPLVNQGTMDKIKEYISQIASPHSRIMVKQPVLEIIQLNFSVKYHDFPGADKRLYAVKLKNVINKYLSPWSFGANDVAFANTIEIATMIQLLDDQPFVDFISDFKVLQGSAGINAAAPTVVKEIIPKTDFTLFIAPDPNFNDDHIIKEITN